MDTVQANGNGLPRCLSRTFDTSLRDYFVSMPSKHQRVGWSERERGRVRSVQLVVGYGVTTCDRIVVLILVLLLSVH